MPKRVILGTVLLLAAAYAVARPLRITAPYLDLNAFYCAAQIQASGGDPYRYEPLHSCEVRNLHPATPNAVVPAPLPPYAVAAFVPLARLSYARAQVVWWLVLLASALLIVWAVIELTRLPLLVVSACVFVAVLLDCLAVGGLATLPIALLTLSAVALKRRRWNVAALFQAIACIEPHLAVPSLVATFVFVPAMRTRLAYAAAAIGVLSLLVGGAYLNAEYLVRVVPAHALSELANEQQYGLSSVLYAFGVPDRASVAIGEAQYLILLVAGLGLVYALRLTLPESVVFVPMAFAVTGGPFIHVTQIAAVIPLALIVASRAQTAIAWLGVALLAVAIPWQMSLAFGGAIAGLVPLAILLYRRAPWGTAVGVSAIVALTLQLWQPVSAHAPFAPIPAIAPAALAEAAWRELTAQFPPTAFSWTGHLVIYLGLGCIYWSLLRLARVEATATHAAPATS